MKTVLKIVLVGILSTALRVCGQLLIPSGVQTVLQPSVFARNGTMSLVFSLYAMVAYSVIAALFLLIRGGMSGNKAIQGLKYGLACAVVWVAYLLEPLPHVTALVDKFSYPIADGISLLWMGLLTGLLLGKTTVKERKPFQISKIVLSVAIIAAFFTVGRLFQYLALRIYSSFDAKMLETIVWSVLTGLVIGAALLWLNRYINGSNRIYRSVILGLLLFGVNLLFFNFFVPLALEADIPDLIIRTVVDLIFVTAGTLFVPQSEHS